MGFPGSSAVRIRPCQCRRCGLIPVGRPEKKWQPILVSAWVGFRGREDWWSTVHRSKRVRQDLANLTTSKIIYSSCTCLSFAVRQHSALVDRGPVSPPVPWQTGDGSDLQNEPFTCRGDARPDTCLYKLMSMTDISMGEKGGFFSFHSLFTLD